MTASGADEKRELRRELLEKRGSLGAQHLASSDAAIAKRLLAMPQYIGAASVFIYVSVGREVQTRGIIEHAWGMGKCVCVPRCKGQGVMEAVRLDSWSGLRPALHGLLEPAADAAALQPGKLGLIVAPCLAATRNGLRLGYGGGYYDRYLASSRLAHTAVLCRESFVLSSLPFSEHDIPVGLIVTDVATYKAEQ